jgi:peroxiredoxin
MKKTICSIAVLVSMTAIAQQQSFTVKGKIGHLNAPAKAYLRYSDNGTNVTDSALINNGQFTFAGKINEPAKANLSVNHTGKGRTMDGLVLFLEKGKISVSSPDSAKNAKVKGGKLNSDLAKLNAALKATNDKSKALNAEYAALTAEQRKDKAVMEEINKKSDAIAAEKREIQKQFIQKNPGSLVSLDALNTYGGYAPNYDEVQPMFSAFSDKVKSSKSGMDYQEKLNKLKMTAVGAMAPDFTQNDPDGTPVSLSSFRGKYVLVDFWASWCGPCRAENPNVVKAYQAFKDKNFTVLGVSLDQPNAKDKWLKAIADDHLEWNHVSDLNYWKNAVAVQYGINAIPQNVLVGPDGKILAKNVRGEELMKTLDRIINNNKTAVK